MRFTTNPAPSEPPASVLVTHEFAPFRGGVATFVQELARAAVAENLPVEVWTVDYRGRALWKNNLDPSGDGPHCDEDAAWPFPVIRLASNGRLTPGGLLGFAWGIWRRRRALRDRRIVLLSVGAQMAFFILAGLGAVSPDRVTCFFHGSEVLRFQKNPVWRWLARRFYARAAGFAVNSFHVEHLLRASGLLPVGAVMRLARCAVPAALAKAEGGRRKAERVSSEESWRVLTVARLHARKGQVEVARALAMLPAGQRERVVYQMAGVGEESCRREIEAACRAGGVRCEFLGALDDPALARLYASATVYVQASRTLPQSVEGFGITFLEAAFCGCPVAAFRSGGVEEAVRDGETALLVAEGDVAALAAAVGRLLGDPDLRARMGEAGRVFAGSFCWEDAAWIVLR